MRRNALLLAIPLALATLTACPGDKKPVAQAPAAPLDTVPTDLSQIQSDIPPASTLPETTVTPPAAARPAAPATRYADAPAALMEAVTREQGAQRACFQERGLKSDPSLQGNVAMLVTVGRSGITGARVADASWSSGSAGRAVNSCLVERARTSWRVAPGAVKAGTYVVQLSFRGS